MILNVPYIEQKANNSCGAACMEMIFKYYGKEIQEDEIVNELLVKCNQSNRKYIRTADIVEYAIQKGFNAFWGYMQIIDGIRMLIDDGFPVIVIQRADIKNESLAHFKVVKGYKKTSFIINDPENINSQITPQDSFLKLWKKQIFGENTDENVFILIYPKNKEIDFNKYTNIFSQS